MEERQSELARGEDTLSTSADGTEGDLIISGSNQEVKIASRRNRCATRWRLPTGVDSLLPVFLPRLAARARLQRRACARESQIISSRRINPALWHRSRMTLIPHLSEAKTCLARDSKRLNLFGLLLTAAPAIWATRSQGDIKEADRSALSNPKRVELRAGPMVNTLRKYIV